VLSMEELQSLVNKAKTGDREAFGQIYNLYFAKIFRYAKFNINDEDEAEDICQETFVKAWKSIEKFDSERPDWSIQAFLFTIARNLIIDRSRKKKDLKINEYTQIETNENFYEDLDHKENVETVKKVLSRLEEIERQIIILRFFEEMDTKEIAGILNMKDGALRVRLHRTMEKMKQITESLYGTRN
jgi:RNA polymerase sigma-70 factor, ECF subfamily